MEQFAPILVEQGLPGLIIAALAWAYWKTRTKLDEVLEGRAEDTRVLIEAQHATADAMKGMSEILRDIQRGVK